MTWVLFAVAGESLGYAFVSIAAAHAWLTVWAGPRDVMPEPVYTALDVSYRVTMAIAIVGFVLGGILWILDRRQPRGG